MGDQGARHSNDSIFLKQAAMIGRSHGSPRLYHRARLRYSHGPIFLLGPIFLYQVARFRRSHGSLSFSNRKDEMSPWLSFVLLFYRS